LRAGSQQNAAPARFHFFIGVLAIFVFFLYNINAIFRYWKTTEAISRGGRRALHISDDSAPEPMLDIGVAP